MAWDTLILVHVPYALWKSFYSAIIRWSCLSKSPFLYPSLLCCSCLIYYICKDWKSQQTMLCLLAITNILKNSVRDKSIILTQIFNHISCSSFIPDVPGFIFLVFEELLFNKSFREELLTRNYFSVS